MWSVRCPGHTHPPHHNLWKRTTNMGECSIHDGEDPSHNAGEYSRLTAPPTPVHNLAFKTKKRDTVNYSDYILQNASEAHANPVGLLRLHATTKMETHTLEESKRVLGII
jgi:hypothetical protein